MNAACNAEIIYNPFERVVYFLPARNIFTVSILNPSISADIEDEIQKTIII